jgi:predicted GNAT family acetyltransferase
MTIHIDHLADRSRFQAVVEGFTCLLDYRTAGQVMTITHTEVPPQLGGRGLAGELMKAALEHARSAGLKVDPRCSYAALYMQRHPEAADLLA